VETLFVTADTARLFDAAHPVHVDDRAMQALAQTVHPRGVVAVARCCDVSLQEALSGSPKLVVVLCGVRDPGNAGTVLRTGAALGADAVVFDDQSVDPFNPKCVRASAGSLFHVPVVTGPGIADIVEAFETARVTPLATDPQAAATLADLQADGALERPVGFLFGNEAHGLPASVDARRVRIPLTDRAESLNLAAAAAICLYAARRGC
jgi:TrmH family RNA methyltransferase